MHVRAGIGLLGLGVVALTGMMDRPIVLYLAGDSTMAQKLAEKRPETGWGEALQQYFDIDQLRVDNRARNGRSTRSFLAEGRWRAILDDLRPGDYVLIQFGHNDEKENTDRYSSPEQYRANLERFVDEVRARKGIPILATPVRRRKFDDAGRLVNTHGAYPDEVRRAAAEKSVPLLDMHALSTRVLERYGPEGSRRLFNQLKPGQNPNYPQGVEDDTHFSPLGAEIMAREAAEGLKALGLPLSRLVRVPAAGQPASP